MKTHFAPPNRSNEEELYRQVQSITHSSLIDGVMHMVGGLIAVLNRNRQILAVNDCLLGILGVDNPEEVLGLRPGEALGCAYSDEMDAGCGTSSYCMSCGAAVAIVSSQIANGPVERECAMVVDKNGRSKDLFFHVMASPIEIHREQFVLVFLHDRTQQQYQASLERAFFHDINNTLSGLLNAGELLSLASPKDANDMAGHIVSLTARLNREVELQRHLSQSGSTRVGVNQELLTVDTIMDDALKTIAHHPSHQGINIVQSNNAPGETVRTDLSLLLRALSNMLINACEASDERCDVRFEADRVKGDIIFAVWNNQCIPPAIQNRIFQRNFSTKDEIGRGLGTFSMKLIGEQLLGGRVSFESSKAQGTWFYLSLPAAKAAD